MTEVAPHKPAPPLGLGLLAAAEYHAQTFELETGDMLLLFTDGLTEARDRHGNFYPLADRVLTWAESGPEELLQRISHDLSRHVGGALGDDAALVALQRVP